MKTETKTKGVLSRLFSHAPRWLALAAAVSLCADSLATDYYTYWENTFEGASAATSGWQKGTLANDIFGTEALSGDSMGSLNLSSGTRTVDGVTSRYFDMYLRAVNQQNCNGAIYVFPEKSGLSDASDYVVSFDWWGGSALDSGNGGIAILAKNPETQEIGNIFVACTPQSGNVETQTGKMYWWKTADSENAKASATGNSNFTHAGRLKNPSDNIYWFHFEIKGYSGDADTDGYLKITVTRPLVDNTTVFEQTLNFAYIYSIFGSVSHGRSGGKYETHWALDDLSVKLPRPDDIPAEPSISVSGDADDDLKIVTVALAEGAASSVTLWYKKSSDAEYTPSASSSIQLEMLNSDIIYAYAENNGNLSDVVYKSITAGYVVTPSGSITSANGISRTVSIVSDYDIEYKTSSDGEYTVADGKTFTVSEATTFYVRARRVSAVDNTKTFYSDVFTITANAGSTAKLVAPTLTVLGLNSLYVSANQSSVDANPTESTQIAYSINGVEQLSTLPLSSGEALLPYSNPTDDDVISVWAKCDGYDDSDKVTFVYSLPSKSLYAVGYEADFVAATYGQNYGHLDKTGGQTNLEIGTGTYGVIVAKFDGASDAVNENVLIKYEVGGGSGNPLRWAAAGIWGLQNQTTAKYFVLQNLQAGDIVYLTGTGMSITDANSNLAVCDDQDIVNVANSSYERYYVVQSDGSAIVNMTANSYLYALRIYRPAAASLDGVGYVTFAKALAAAETAGGGTITLNADVTGDVEIPAAGISIICGDYSISGNVTGARSVGASYNSTTKTYTSSANTAATWVGGATGRWLDPLNWSTKSIPTWDTDVTIDTDCTIYITGTAWGDDFSTRDMCRGMTIDANVALQSGATPGWCFLALYGNVTGSGKLTLTWVGIDGLSSPTTTLGCDIKINSAYDDYYSCYRDSCFLNYDRNISYAITRNIEVGENAILNAFYNTDISGTLTLDNGASVYAGENVTLTLGNIIVADGATAKVSKHATGASYTVSGTVSAATSAYNAKGTTSGDMTTYTSTLRPVVEPGEAATATYDTEAAAQAAAADVAVAVPTAVAERLTDDQEAAYVAMFEAKAVESTTESGKYVVTVDFTAAAEAEIKAAENAITVVDGATPQVTVTAKPGLYYFVKAGTAADSLTVTGNGTMATGDSVTLDMPLPDSGVKYYKVVASPTSSL